MQLINKLPAIMRSGMKEKNRLEEYVTGHLTCQGTGNGGWVRGNQLERAELNAIPTEGGRGVSK